MLQIRNGTPFSPMVVLLPDADGIDTLFAIVKGTFSIADRLTIAAEQVDVVPAAEYHGDPKTSSVKRPSDVSLVKPATDVVVLGSARPRGGLPVREMHVSVSVGSMRHDALVSGDRSWVDTATGYRASEPEPFSAMPLTWERSFGGRDETPKGPREEARNPVGTAFRLSNGTSFVAGVALPNVESLTDRLSAWDQQTVPTGFAPICEHWEPRRSFAGTYDEAWRKQRAPYLPSDFDPRFLQIAPPELVAPGYLAGGEPVGLDGFSAEGPLRFSLPVLRLTATYLIDGAREQRPAFLDTIILEPDDRRLSLVWRASLPCDKRALRVKEIEIGVSGLAEWR